MTAPTIARRNYQGPRDCPWTAARHGSPGRDLPWLAQPPGWTPLADCGVQVAVRYHCAEPGLRAGGDWHLSMPLANGDLLLAIGDVAGHGLAAAAVMARLRYAMAALAVTSRTPAAILDGLNAVACRRGDITATAAAARYCPPALLDYVRYDAAGDDACVLVAERIR